MEPEATGKLLGIERGRPRPERDKRAISALSFGTGQPVSPSAWLWSPT
jgi:hypothetical protein